MKSKTRPFRRSKKKKDSIPYLITRAIRPRSSIKAVHRYADRLYYNADLSAAVSMVFRLNSVYDPDQAFTNLLGNRNAQPRYRDQVATLYGNYRVFYTTFKVTVQNQGVVAGDDLEFVVYKRGINMNDTIPTSNSGILQEHPGRVGGGVVGLGRGGNAIKSVSGSWSEKELSRENRLNNYANSGTNPSESPELVLALVGGASGDNIDNVSVTIEFEYHTLWTEPQYANGS